MFAWQMTLLFEVLLYIYAIRFSYFFYFQSKISRVYDFLLTIIFFVFTFSLPTRYNIASYDINNCEGVLGNIWDFVYVFEICVIVIIPYLGYLSYKRTQDKDIKKQIAIFSLGMTIFLSAFFSSNFFGEFTGFYEFNLWGPLGMLLFLSLLFYLIVKFRKFNSKLIGSNVLIFALWCLTGSLLFIQDIDVSHAVTAVTLIISIVLGFFMIESIRKEVHQRERIESLANDLSIANGRLLELDKQKSEFVSLATHQLRAPLTAMKGYTSLILEGEMGEIQPETKQAVTRIYDSANTLTNIVNDYLNISRIELGTMKYNFTSLDFKKLIEDVIGELKPNIEKKGLQFTFNCDPSQKYTVHADVDKLKQVIANLIDNSLKYTPSGKIELALIRKNLEHKLLFSVKDTGVGIAPEVMTKLFSKFVRSDNANKQNIYGTGLGLYVAKQMIIAHKGRVWAESLGDGKGSTFFVELDSEM
jgi:signal transduction histidine kinase